MGAQTVIVGAGLAGLVCAKRLRSAGHNVLLLDKSERPGGRMRTDPIDGFLVDQGFQVLFTAYPHARRELDYGRLGLRKYVPGAMVLWDGKMHEVRRDDPVSMALSGFLPLGDKLRVASLSLELAAESVDDIWQDADQSAAEMFRSRGFSQVFIERFARPFFGGVFLDRGLDFSANMLRFVWKMLNEGDTVAPALGIGQIPQQVFADLPEACFQGGTEVTAVHGGEAPAVRLSNGDVIEAEAVVVATDSEQAASLTGLSLPTQFRSSVTVSFAASERPVEEPILVLNGDFPGRVNHVAVLSAVSPDLAPPGQELVTATLLGASSKGDGELAAEVRYELAHWFPGKKVSQWAPLRVDRIEKAQLVQSSGFHASRPGNATPLQGVFLASECTENASIDGAVLSGARCAETILARSAVTAR
jgi:phytoene dehydrogenase-like protein